MLEVKNSLVTPANNLTMINDVYVHIPFDTSPSTHFVWNEYYHNLSLSGLQDCSFFKSEIGTFNNDGSIATTIDQTKMQSYNQYNARGNENLQKTCN